MLENLLAKLPITLLQACPDIFETVRPDAIFVSVFPIIASRRDRCMILADQHRLDASRAELNAKNSPCAINCFLGIVSIHVHLSGLEVISSNFFSGKTVCLRCSPSFGQVRWVS